MKLTANVLALPGPGLLGWGASLHPEGGSAACLEIILTFDPQANHYNAIIEAPGGGLRVFFRSDEHDRPALDVSGVCDGQQPEIIDGRIIRLLLSEGQILQVCVEDFRSGQISAELLKS